MTQYIKSPDMITIAPDFSGIAIDNVPAGYYRIAVAMGIGFHLVPVDPLEVPSKIYGSLLKHAPRIKEVFDERVGLPTTVLLEGLKGSGKSLLMKTLAKQFVENEGGIVLLCNNSFAGDDFFQFLQQIEQKKIVLMDEFDKVYSNTSERNSILTLLDGTYASHTLFILTMNASSASDSFTYFHNRPGRVFFSIKFKSVELDAIEGYLNDLLQDKGLIPEIMMFVKRFTAFNMDMLGTLVREVNACPQLTLEEISEYLNIKPDISIDDMFFSTQVLIDDINVTNHISAYRINSANIRDYLSNLQRNPRGAVLNVESTNNINFNVTKNIPWDGNKHDSDVDKNAYGIAVRKGSKLIFIPYTDCYLRGDEADFSQDPTTGVITISQSLPLNSDSEIKRKVTLVITPEMIKRHNYSF